MYQDTGILCPHCAGRIMESDKAFGCENWREKDGGCKVTIWKETCGHQFTRDEVERVLAGEKIGPFDLQFKSGKTGNGSLYFSDEENRVKIEFTPKEQ